MACEAAFLVTRRESLAAAAFWNLVAGAALALVALLSGWTALGTSAPDQAATALLALHRAIGIVAVSVFAGLAAWRIVLRGRPVPRGRTVYMMLAFAAATALLTASVLGQVAVYQHGAGVAKHRAQ